MSDVHSTSDPAARDRLPSCHDGLVGSILAAFYAVYREMGFGFLESVYHKALALELAQRGLSFENQVPFGVFYKGRKIGHYRADLCVEGRAVVEVRSGWAISQADRAQLAHYVRCGNLPVGLLLLFGPRPEFLRVDGECLADAARGAASA